AIAKVEVIDPHRQPARPEPLDHQLWIGEGLVNQIPRSIELSRDDDLLRSRLCRDFRLTHVVSFLRMRDGFAPVVPSSVVDWRVARSSSSCSNRASQYRR